MAARGLTLPCFSSSSTALMLETQISVVWFQIIPESPLCCGGVLRPVRSACFSSQVLFCRDKRGHGPMAADKNAKQPWPDQTGSPRCYLPACSTVLVPWGKKVKEPGMKLAGVSATAARCLTLRGKGGFQPLKGEKWPRLHIVLGCLVLLSSQTKWGHFFNSIPKMKSCSRDELQAVINSSKIRRIWGKKTSFVSFQRLDSFSLLLVEEISIKSVCWLVITAQVLLNCY